MFSLLVYRFFHNTSFIFLGLTKNLLTNAFILSTLSEPLKSLYKFLLAFFAKLITSSSLGSSIICSVIEIICSVEKLVTSEGNASKRWVTTSKVFGPKEITDDFLKMQKGVCWGVGGKLFAIEPGVMPPTLLTLPVTPAIEDTMPALKTISVSASKALSISASVTMNSGVATIEVVCCCCCRAEEQSTGPHTVAF
ncbi:hypothetical protein FF38_09114 [Lucilia cuprina]|uniref:Uncharacterized protein n=1 Tax=Lucilia cuprina TaxID=7375 RepID=A0A0L0BU62_LUCCU|nr:hypothetical protein FF38_09114 [Lucilia cuprina]